MSNQFNVKDNGVLIRNVYVFYHVTYIIFKLDRAMEYNKEGRKQALKKRKSLELILVQ